MSYLDVSEGGIRRGSKGKGPAHYGIAMLIYRDRKVKRAIIMGLETPRNGKEDLESCNKFSRRGKIHETMGVFKRKERISQRVGGPGNLGK